MRQLVNWFRRKQLERDLERELQYHLDRRITDLNNSGLPAQEARKHAMVSRPRRRFVRLPAGAAVLSAPPEGDLDQTHTPG